MPLIDARLDSVAVVLGSTFSARPPADLDLVPVEVATPWGDVTLHFAQGLRNDLNPFVIFRHGLPHQRLPHLIPYRAYAAALKVLGCRALLLTSSVGVLDQALPLHTSLLLHDLLMPDMRLSDGSLCTMFNSIGPPLEPPAISGAILHIPTFRREELTMALHPAHLVWRGGPSSHHLDTQVKQIALEQGLEVGPSVTFAYVPGPRTKTPSENRYWGILGAQVNSMSVGPELVLASELEIPCSALLIGHKHSSSDQGGSEQSARTKQQAKIEMSHSLTRSHQELSLLIRHFLSSATAVPFDHYLYRFPS